ncbi:MAG: hypothetical protein HYZ11_01705 [Candidatus Tectomicrobia bacterium]|uniref:Cytochrome c7-like domain-containing protein n=1 Tax=Tectimicrobiota bacterium TaxID=2528274 RepID=A0A932HYR6_UNCTE|nr:hypothetical protein [Candidatus Tectomicrobia bacterium]
MIVLNRLKGASLAGLFLLGLTGLALAASPPKSKEPQKKAAKEAVAVPGAASADPRWSEKHRKYEEKNWAFDIVNGNIRFSHGNHKNRDRWFRAYFRQGYSCGICHSTAVPQDDGKGYVKMSKGDPLATVEDIRDAKDEAYAYGVSMLTCLGNCHNGFTAPNNCDWCHLPQSKPIKEGQKEIKKW